MADIDDAWAEAGCAFCGARWSEPHRPECPTLGGTLGVQVPGFLSSRSGPEPPRTDPELDGLLPDPAFSDPAVAGAAAFTAQVGSVLETAFAQAESAARAALVERLAEVFRRRQAFGPFIDYWQETPDSIADTAVEVFVEFLRNPPTRVVDVDGVATLQWPDGG